jgi:glycerol-3-phosphate dehydrogenase
MLDKIKDNSVLWDIVVIGGGASGLGSAVDSVSRGYNTLLLEKQDFAQETSSRSTKLIHGGIRYLEQGYFSLVREALSERFYLLQNAPHLVHPIAFILPTNSWFKTFYYYMGMKLYDFLAGKRKIKSATWIPKKEAKKKLEAVKSAYFNSGVQFYDAQFDDARMAINLAETLVDLGGTAINYMSVVRLLKNEQGGTIGVVARDYETGREYPIKAKAVVNATGAFVDRIRVMDNPELSPAVVVSQGAHIVLDKSFFPQEDALVISETSDKRVVFIIPWHRHILIGTTETKLDQVVENPKPLAEEIDYLLDHCSRVMRKVPTKADILGAFAGIRPLAVSNKIKGCTAKISREHAILVSPSKLISIVGGKWTTYRKIGEDAIDMAVKIAGLPPKPSDTTHLRIHGYQSSNDVQDEWSYYGSDRHLVEQLANGDPSLLQKYHEALPCRPVDVLWAVRMEMARTVEDVLSRRTRCLLLNAKASEEMAPKVAELIARERIKH